MKFVIIFALILVAFTQYSYAAAVPADENAAFEGNAPQDDDTTNTENIQSDASSDTDTVNANPDAGTGEAPPSAGYDGPDVPSDNAPTTTDGDTTSTDEDVTTMTSSDVEESGEPKGNHKSVSESYSRMVVKKNGRVVDAKREGQRVVNDNGHITVTKLNDKPFY